MPDDRNVIWTIHEVDGPLVECRMDFAPNGVEVVVTSDGTRVDGGLFATGTEALAWAEEAREQWASGAQ